MRFTQRFVGLMAILMMTVSVQFVQAATSSAVDPIVLTATLDKETYEAGALATLTVTENVAGRRIAVRDTSGVTWVKGTDTGKVITYTATVHTSATVNVTLTRTADGAKATASDSYTVTSGPDPEPGTSSTLALLGDTPYSATERTQFPALVRQINADSSVEVVLHAGDIKSADSVCDNAVYQDRLALFSTFADPFVLTPGDNEWVDCQKIAGGQYVPTERLSYLRETFYPQLGGQGLATVVSQTNYPENVRFEQSGAVFAAIHVVGNGNGRQQWSDLPGGDQPTVRKAEYQARETADLAWIDAAFNNAQAQGAAGVVLLMQAEPKATTPFIAIRNKIIDRAQNFSGQVLIVHGDEHIYESEPGYAGVSNLTRLETYGKTATRWLELTVDPNTAAVFSWAQRTVS